MPGAYLLQGDAREIPLADGSVQCVVTSPPYWGLRDYGLPPMVWGGEPGHAHEWGSFSGRPCLVQALRLALRAP